MSNFRRYVISSLVAGVFAALMPSALVLLYVHSINFVNSVGRPDGQLQMSFSEGLWNLFDAAPHLVFLALIPAYIGFRCGLVLTSDRAPRSPKSRLHHRGKR